MVSIVGSTRPEREDARARTAYVASARRFAGAMGAFATAGVPVVPRGSSHELPMWERYDVEVMLELQAALNELIATRRAYDAGRRSQRSL